MENNKIFQTIILGSLLLVSMWSISALLEARNDVRSVVIGIGFFLVLLITLFRALPLDAKLLFLAILGYALGGRGFAYLSPAEPLYIGEICLFLCMGGLLLRISRAGLMDTPMHKLVWVYLIYGGVHLMLDYSAYGLMSLRDSATVYYSLFFVATYSLLSNGSIMNVFERILKLALIFSVFQMAVYVVIMKLNLHFEIPGFGPHVDAFVPLNVAAVLFFLVKGFAENKKHYILLGVGISIALLGGKTAGIVALTLVMIVAIWYGRLKSLLVPAVLTGSISFVVFIVSLVMFPNVVGDFGSGEITETFGLSDGEFVGLSGTSQWRVDWWMIVWHDTMRIAPFWGQGFGADITTPFLVDWIGIDPSSSMAQNYARYPHNILFTIIGRLGLIGLFVFLGLFISIGIFVLRFCKRYFRSEDLRDADLIAFGVVSSGMINALLQLTYESPHGAIPHWVCLGYMAARYYKPTLIPDPEKLDRA